MQWERWQSAQAYKHQELPGSHTDTKQKHMIAEAVVVVVVAVPADGDTAVELA